MSRPDDLGRTLDDTEGHSLNSGADAGVTSAQDDETNNRMAPSLVSLPWARHWVAADTLTI